ncbi:MAG: hypothetical protein M1824_001791 [Vezdaea acicularis]|nr:MAG: hypothetical protein M1824_001791 [Vezdaea acicularis]
MRIPDSSSIVYFSFHSWCLLSSLPDAAIAGGGRNQRDVRYTCNSELQRSNYDAHFTNRKDALPLNAADNPDLTSLCSRLGLAVSSVGLNCNRYEEVADLDWGRSNRRRRRRNRGRDDPTITALLGRCYRYCGRVSLERPEAFRKLSETIGGYRNAQNRSQEESYGACAIERHIGRIEETDKPLTSTSHWQESSFDRYSRDQIILQDSTRSLEVPSAQDSTSRIHVRNEQHENKRVSDARWRTGLSHSYKLKPRGVREQSDVTGIGPRLGKRAKTNQGGLERTRWAGKGPRSSRARPIRSTADTMICAGALPSGAYNTWERSIRMQPLLTAAHYIDLKDLCSLYGNPVFNLKLYCRWYGPKAWIVQEPLDTAFPDLEWPLFSTNPSVNQLEEYCRERCQCRERPAHRWRSELAVESRAWAKTVSTAGRSGGLGGAAPGSRAGGLLEFGSALAMWPRLN